MEILNFWPLKSGLENLNTTESQKFISKDLMLSYIIFLLIIISG